MPGPQFSERSAPPLIPDHELLRRVGSGAYGEVWLARTVLSEWRAVKIIHRSEFDDDRPYEREFAGIRKFEPISRSHEGFVDLLQVGRNDVEGCFYYVMELADCVENPKREIRTSKVEGTATPEEHRVTSVELPSDFDIRHPDSYQPRTLAAALVELHRHGLVHRDIKPSSIIFVGGVPKLADIGLVAATNEARSFVGTIGFIPPEGPGTPQADLYSLGIVLYVMSTGKTHRDFPEPPADLTSRPDRERGSNCKPPGRARWICRSDSDKRQCY